MYGDQKSPPKKGNLIDHMGEHGELCPLIIKKEKKVT
jgi:hypothetical protein